MQLGRRVFFPCLGILVVVTFIYASFSNRALRSSRDMAYYYPHPYDGDAEMDNMFDDSEYQPEDVDQQIPEDDDDEEDDDDDSGIDYSKLSTTSPFSKRLGVDHETLTGTNIASKLDNETAKAELGRASWKLFHTTFSRFPDRPSKDEQEALRAWVLLFARLYPCGECARHFQSILTKFAPQVATRSDAAAWGCHVHNEVNKSLNKPLFDCSKIGDFYDCGCADDDNRNDPSKKTTSHSQRKSDIPDDELEPVDLSKEE